MKRAVLLLVGITLWFSWLNWYPGFKDSDGFYHAKLVELMRDHGLVREFPWLPLTVLSDHFADHHLLYHTAIVPLSRVVSPLVATKIVSVSLGIMVCMLLYWLLRKMKAPQPELLIALLAITPYFALRATMAKASGAAMLVQFALLAAIMFRKRFLMFALSVIYVWTHGGFPFALIMIAALVGAKIFTRMAETGEWRPVLRSVWNEEWRHVVLITSGLIVGLVANPYFPENLQFYWHQIVQIAVRGTPSELLVGAEWYGVDKRELFFVSLPLLAALIVPAVTLIITKRVPHFERERAERFMWLFLLTAGTFLMTVRSNRHAEYFLPYLTLFIGEVHRVIASRVDLRVLPKTKLTLAAGALLLLVPIFEIVMTHAWLRHDILPFDGARGAAEFVRSVAEPHEIVFDGNWDFFPQLWYWNAEQRYISGLDPRFFGAKDEVLALLYQNFNDPDEPIRDMFAKFPVRYIVMPKTQPREKALLQLKNDTQNFAQIYEDSYSIVFVKKH